VSLAELVGTVLEQAGPENIDPKGPVVTGEGPEVEIVIIAHRDLGGVSMVAWSDTHDARLVWANVGDLSTHDDLDLGVVVERIAFKGDWHGRLREAIAAELRRPVRLRSRSGWFRRRRVECWINIAGRDQRIGTLRPPKDQVSGGPQEMTTSLAGGPRPWFSLAPDITGKH
jgi:hypothetical protein